MSYVSSWSNLPEELLALIKNRLESPSDISRFRAVCSSWRSSNFHIFKDHLDQFVAEVDLRNNLSSEECLLIQKTIFCLEAHTDNSSSLSCWLFGVEKSGGKLYFVNPFTSMIIHPRPRRLPEVLDLFDYSKITKLQELNIVRSFHEYTDGTEEYEARKALFLSPPHYEEAMLYVGSYSHGRTWTLCKLQNGQWGEGQEINPGFNVHDIALYKGRIWIVDGEGCTRVLDSTFKTMEIAQHLFPEEMRCLAYLVESSLSGLFLVEKQEHWPSDIFRSKRGDGMSISWWIYRLRMQLLLIKVYKLQEEENRWEEVTHLDDQIMFVCCGDYGVSPWSFCVPTTHIPGCKGNSIVFTFNNKHDSLIGNHENPENAGVFDMETGKLRLLQRCPGYASLFWPPPSWLKINALPFE
ncbi:hypothetical protein LIER_04957 [Lithospermum erythrorhizon]|uniref:F-box domain-containing protein n=1 Tax=Lithospermum erythrorhizon TaxID=34254 RepID=A0AAV3NYX0_LITER